MLSSGDRAKINSNTNRYGTKQSRRSHKKEIHRSDEAPQSGCIKQARRGDEKARDRARTRKAH